MRLRPFVPGRRAAWLAAAALLVAVLAVFGQVVSFGFVDYDDGDYVFRNPHLREGPLLERVRWAFTAFHAANWHPLTWLSFIADGALFGLDPGPLHAENLALHALNTLLVLALLARATGSVGKSALVAALFALHPLRAESVAWVTERKGLLMALFCLAALHAHLGYARRLTAGRALAVAGCTAAAMLAKPQAVALPILLLVWDWWPLGRFGRGTPAGASRRVAFEKVPLFVLAGALGLLTLAAQGRAGTVAPLVALPPAERLANAAVAPLLYLAKTLWPAGLSPLYPLVSQPAGLVAVAVAVLAASVAAAARWRRTQPWLAAGVLGFLALLAPVSGILQAGQQTMADRYAYLPHLPLFALVVWTGGRLLAHRPRPARAAAVAATLAAIAVLGGAAHRQTALWRDDLALFAHAVSVTEGNWKMHYNLANTLERRGGSEDDVRRHYELAIAARPDHHEALNNLGVLHGRRGNAALAEALFARAVTAKPDYGMAWFNLGFEREKAGDLPGAIQAYARAAALQSGSAEPRARMERLLSAQGSDGAGSAGASRSRGSLSSSSATPAWPSSR